MYIYIYIFIYIYIYIYTVYNIVLICIFLKSVILSSIKYCGLDYFKWSLFYFM